MTPIEGTCLSRAAALPKHPTSGGLCCVCPGRWSSEAAEFVSEFVRLITRLPPPHSETVWWSSSLTLSAAQSLRRASWACTASGDQPLLGDVLSSTRVDEPLASGLPPALSCSLGLGHGGCFFTAHGHPVAKRRANKKGTLHKRYCACGQAQNRKAATPCASLTQQRPQGASQAVCDSAASY